MIKISPKENNLVIMKPYREKLNTFQKQDFCLFYLFFFKCQTHKINQKIKNL